MHELTSEPPAAKLKLHIASRTRIMSARQLNRLAKAKGLDPLLGGSLNVDSDESDVPEDSEEEGGNFASGVVVSASVGDALYCCSCSCLCALLGYLPLRLV